MGIKELLNRLFSEFNGNGNGNGNGQHPDAKVDTAKRNNGNYDEAGGGLHEVRTWP